MISMASVRVVEVMTMVEAREPEEAARKFMEAAPKLFEYSHKPLCNRLNGEVFKVCAHVRVDDIDDHRLVVYEFIRNMCPSMFALDGTAQFDLKAFALNLGRESERVSKKLMTRDDVDLTVAGLTPLRANRRG